MLNKNHYRTEKRDEPNLYLFTRGPGRVLLISARDSSPKESTVMFILFCIVVFFFNIVNNEQQVQFFF